MGTHGGFVLLLLAYCLRLLLVFSPGYIHPDEFFQGGQEVFATSILHIEECFVPWEFRPEHALRSVAFPWLISGLPMLLLKRVVSPLLLRLGVMKGTGAPPHLRGAVLLHFPRLVILVLSSLQDWCLVSLSPPTSQAWLLPLLSASSWPVLLFSSRPFSNTLESLLLALSLALCFHTGPASLLLTRAQVRGRARLRLLGCLLCVGCWCRFTFAAFAVPLVALEAHRAMVAADESSRKKEKGQDVGSGMRLGSGRPWRAVACLAMDLWGGALAPAMVLTAIDTWYYGRQLHQEAGMAWLLRPVITPLRALHYNSRASNLQAHGLHPRVTHALVNMPMLFLVPYLLLLRRLVRGKRPWQQQQQPADSPSSPQAAARPCPSRELEVACLSIIASGLLVLSLAPHQEPRFLLPLSTPLLLLLSSLPQREGAHPLTRRPWQALWLVHNAACLLFFGWLHQAGLTRMMAKLEPRLSPGTTVIFHKTYMPPRFLLAGALTSGGVKVLDLNDATPPQIRSAVNATTTTSGVGGSGWVVVAPASIPDLRLSGALPSDARVMESVWPHLSTEDWPSWHACTAEAAASASSRSVMEAVRCLTIDQMSLLAYSSPVPP